MKTNEMLKKRQRRHDLFLVVALLAVAAIGMVFLLLRESGDTVQIIIDGKLYKTYALSQTTVEDLRTDGDALNRLVIRDGKAFIETATCPDGICAAHRPIFRNGESIMCLPHGIVVTIARTHTDDDVDMVV